MRGLRGNCWSWESSAARLLAARRGARQGCCLAHARRKFFDLHVANKSQVAESALQQIGAIYEIERELKDLDPDERHRIRQLASARRAARRDGLAQRASGSGLIGSGTADPPSPLPRCSSSGSAPPWP
jgi:hypothetical protein